MSQQVFFPQALLDVLMDSGHVDVDGDELVLSASGYRYKVEEAVRILREVTTGEDPQNLCGKVRGRARLADELGAELLGTSMLVEDWAFDVVPGLCGTPTGDAPAGAPPEATVLSELARTEQ